MRFARLIFFLFCLARGTGRDVIVSRDGGCGCARCTIYVFKSLAMRPEYFLSHPRRRARGCRARVPSRAPRSRPARAEKIQGTRAKLSNRLFIVFTHAPPRARTRIRPYPRGCSPRTRGSSSQRSFSPSFASWKQLTGRGTVSEKDDEFSLELTRFLTSALRHPFGGQSVAAFFSLDANDIRLAAESFGRRFRDCVLEQYNDFESEIQEMRSLN